MLRSLILLLPLLFSMGCLASGIRQEEGSLILLGGFFLVITGAGAPYLYVPPIKQYMKKRAFGKFKSWDFLAKQLGLRLYISQAKSYVPTVYGTYKEHSVSITPSRGTGYLVYQIPIFNPKLVFLMFKDRSFLDPKNNFFINTLSGVSNDVDIEKRFVIKSDSEIFLRNFVKAGFALPLKAIEASFSLEVTGSNLVYKQKVASSLDNFQVEKTLGFLIQFTENFESLAQVEKLAA
jgi:hypothetical protein